MVAYGCTAAGFIAGPRGEAQLAEELAAITGKPVVTTARSMVAALQAAAARRIALVTPYSDEVNRNLGLFLAEGGSRRTASAAWPRPMSKRWGASRRRRWRRWRGTRWTTVATRCSSPVRNCPPTTSWIPCRRSSAGLSGLQSRPPRGGPCRPWRRRHAGRNRRHEKTIETAAIAPDADADHQEGIMKRGIRQSAATVFAGMLVFAAGGPARKAIPPSRSGSSFPIAPAASPTSPHGSSRPTFPRRWASKW